jgi:hypothetical protein
MIKTKNIEENVDQKYSNKRPLLKTGVCDRYYFLCL